MQAGKQSLLLLFFLLYSYTLGASSTGNPFLPMLKQPYGEYAKQMIDWRTRLDLFMEQPEADTLMMHIQEAARLSHTNRWKLEASLMDITYRFRYKTRHEEGNTYTADSALVHYTTLANEALATEDTLMYLRAQRDVMNTYYTFIYNYALAFDMAWQLHAALNHIPADTLPDKLLAYNDMANMYYSFRDYDEAGQLLKAIAAEPAVANHLHLLQHVYNTLGLIHFKHYHNPDTAEIYFHKILDLTPEGHESSQHLKAWEGIAKGNIGRIYATASRFDEAIPLAEFSCRRMAEVNDYSFAAGMATLLANIYLNREAPQPTQASLQKAKQYIDLANKYINQSYLPPRQDELYEVTARYHVFTGNTQMAVAYMDSANNAREAYNQEFNALELKRAEQRMHQQEQLAKEEQLRAERTHSTWLQRLLKIIIIWLVLISILLAIIIVLYRRKRRAYRVLAKKAREWAHNQEAGQTPVSPISPEEKELMQRIRQLLEQQRAFVEPELTLIEVATRLDVNRTYISAAINHCTGDSFSNYLAELRIREAVRILSDPANEQLTIDAVASAAGFNDRHNFYRAFKRITGLSPSAFRANISKKTPYCSERE